MEIMCAVDFKTMELQESLSDICIEYSGGIESIEKLLFLLKDFSEVSNYYSFFKVLIIIFLILSLTFKSVMAMWAKL